MKASEFKTLAFRNVFKVQDKNNLRSEGEGQKQNPIDVDDPTTVSDTDSRNRRLMKLAMANGLKVYLTAQ